MTPDDKSNAIAGFLEARRQELLSLVQQRVSLLDLADASTLVEECFNRQIEYLRTGLGHTYEWTAEFVASVRAGGGRIHDILVMLRDVRDLMNTFCAGRIEGVTDADLYRLSLAVEDNALAQIAELYSETERKIAAADRRQQKMIAEWMDRAFVTVDGDGKVVLTNTRFGELVGLTEDRLLGRDFASLCDPDTDNEVRRALRHKGAAAPRTFNAVLVTPKGARLPVQCSILPMFDEEGLRSGAAIGMADLDGAAALPGDAFRSKVIEGLAATLGLGCYVIDGTCRVISCNAPGREFVEVGAEDNRASCCRTHLGEHGQCGDCLRRRVFETGEPYRTTVQYKMPAGALRWVEMTCIPVRGEHGGISRVAKLVRDVTEQRLLEDQILHQQRTSLASQLAITVAHQLRNPLGVMIGFAEMLSHGLPPDQMSNAVQRLLRNGLRCKEIVQNLLEFGRGAPGEHVLADLNAIVVNQVKPVYPASVASRIAWRLAENLPPVECAPDQLAQVFINLLDNALWSAKSTVALETSSRDDSVYIRVWDDGPGVPEADREHIFEPFFTTRKDDGSIGLGLSLSRAVVQEHRGLLFLDDAVPQGACFVIQLPAAENIGGAAPVEAPPQALSRPGRRILIVEDETDLLFLLTMALESLGYTVDTAATGAHAMDLIEQTAYDAIVIDMLLADELGGGGLYRILQSARPQLTARSLFITGDTMKYETRRFLTEVRRPFLEKPFMIADFAQTVRDIIEAEKSNPAANGERA